MNVFVIGNGFDIQHGLPTSYNDFFKVIKPKNKEHKLSVEIENARRDPGYSGVFKKMFDKHPELLGKINTDNILILENKLQKNVWAQYYSKCQAEINGWIDFENEIHPAIELFQKVFNSDDISFAKDGYGEDVIRVLTKDELINRRTELFTKFFGVIPGDGKLEVKAEYIYGTELSSCDC